MNFPVAACYLDFLAGCAFFAEAAGGLAAFGAGFLSREDVLLASAEVLLGDCFLGIGVLHRLNHGSCNR
jgi:hypothetical protein